MKHHNQIRYASNASSLHARLQPNGHSVSSQPLEIKIWPYLLLNAINNSSYRQRQVSKLLVAFNHLNSNNCSPLMQTILTKIRLFHSVIRVNNNYTCFLRKWRPYTPQATQMCFLQCSRPSTIITPIIATQIQFHKATILLVRMIIRYCRRMQAERAPYARA